ncbi:BTAD domain-containing putative transcriptional regulator [Streptomyces bacillaris]
MAGPGLARPIPVLADHGALPPLATPRVRSLPRRHHRILAVQAPPRAAVALWGEALACWRGPVLSDFPAAAWAAAEGARLEALRLDAVERRADALMANGAARDAVADLRAHVSGHPGRDDGWVLLATALNRAGRPGEALAALARAREALSGGGTALARTEARIHSATKQSPAEPAGTADSVWNRAAASWDRPVPARSQARLHATAGLLRDLAVTGPDGLEEAHRHRREAAEATGDPELAARVIGSYDVPAVWTRAGDPGGSGELCRAAARTAARLGPDGSPALRARMLSVVAVESRGDAALVALVPVMRGDTSPRPGDFDGLDAGPYQLWLDPLLLAASGDSEGARQALSTVPRPPHDLLQEALWCVLARAAASVGHLPVLRRARDELAPAAAEYAGAGSGLVSFGPVTRHLAAADAAIEAHASATGR